VLEVAVFIKIRPVKINGMSVMMPEVSVKPFGATVFIKIRPVEIKDGSVRTLDASTKPFD